MPNPYQARLGQECPSCAHLRKRPFTPVSAAFGVQQNSFAFPEHALAKFFELVHGRCESLGHCFKATCFLRRSSGNAVAARSLARPPATTSPRTALRLRRRQPHYEAHRPLRAALHPCVRGGLLRRPGFRSAGIPGARVDGWCMIETTMLSPAPHEALDDLAERTDVGQQILG